MMMWLFRGAFVVALLGWATAPIAANLWPTLSHLLALVAAVAGAPLSALVVLAARAVQKRRDIEGLGALAILVAVAIPGWSIVGAYAINTKLDGTARFRPVEVVSKRAFKSGKSHYQLVKLAPAPPFTEPLEIDVPGQAYARLPAKGPARMWAGEGRLGFAWVGALQPPE